MTIGGTVSILSPSGYTSMHLLWSPKQCKAPFGPVPPFCDDLEAAKQLHLRRRIRGLPSADRGCDARPLGDDVCHVVHWVVFTTDCLLLCEPQIDRTVAEVKAKVPGVH